MSKPKDMESMYDWLMHTDAEDARRATSVCECGVVATYKGKKDFDTTYMHSYYCPMYKDKPKDNDKQKEA